jgi:hypothetical protein
MTNKLEQKNIPKTKPTKREETTPVSLKDFTEALKRVLALQKK